MLGTQGSPLLFFLLVFAFSAPVWLIGAVSRWLLLPGVPASGIMAMCPALAATLLVYREGGISAIATLFKRSFDYTCITNSVWLLPMLLLMPAVMFISYAAMRLFELPLPVVEINWSAVPLLFLVLFFAAFTEELGWSGYVLDPLLDRWSALRASLVLGSVWAAWHLVPLQQAGCAATWIAWWCLATVSLRILHTWLYCNTGHSILGQALFHASFNTSWQLFPNNGSHYNPKITGLVLAVTAMLVVWRWGPSRLVRQTHS